ncbi:MAG: hypothetical protein WA130_02175 [Candidatus Methanoperedens sp.]
MSIENIPKTQKKNIHMDHETEKSMKDLSVGMMNDVKLTTDGKLTHKDTKTKKLPSDLI